MFFVPIYVGISQYKCKQAPPKKQVAQKQVWFTTAYLFVFADLATASPIFVRHMQLHNQSYNPAASDWQQWLWILCNVKCKQGQNSPMQEKFGSTTDFSTRNTLMSHLVPPMNQFLEQVCGSTSRENFFLGQSGHQWSLEVALIFRYGLGPK